MAINCSSNSLLDSLNAKKDLLNSKVASLQSAGAAAMGDLAAKAASMKDALLASIPEIPEIPNFKKELAELAGKVGAELAEAKAAFKERWGDALPDIDIDGLMNRIGSFDLCKDVPNIDAPVVSPEGKVEAVKVKAEEPIVAAAIPKKVEVVVPTVVEKEKAVSVKPTVTVSRDELADAKDAMRREIDGFLSEFRTNKTAASRLSARNRASTNIWNKIIKNKDKDGLTLIEYYNSGQGKKVDRILVKKYLISEAEAAKWNTILLVCLSLTRYSATLGTGDEFQQILKREKSKINLGSLEEVIEDGEYLSTRTVTGYGSTLQSYANILEKHATIIEQIESYRNA
jgi:hypothetical protein